MWCSNNLLNVDKTKIVLDFRRGHMEHVPLNINSCISITPRILQNLNVTKTWEWKHLHFEKPLKYQSFYALMWFF